MVASQFPEGKSPDDARDRSRSVGDRLPGQADVPVQDVPHTPPHDISADGDDSIERREQETETFSEPQDEECDEGISLEELSRTYADMLGGPQIVAAAPTSPASTGDEERSESEASDPTLNLFDPDAAQASDEQRCPATPLSILEAVLFVGRPDSGVISSREIASLMRGVDEDDVAALVEQLNTGYEEQARAFRVTDDGSGYRLQLADDLRFLVDRFYGQVREVKLSQSAIDCLALVAYQPGISREQLEKQRGQASGSVLNQLVRRQLLEMRREVSEEGARPTPHYYPTERLLQLSGLESLDDLPQAEDF